MAPTTNTTTMNNATKLTLSNEERKDVMMAGKCKYKTGKCTNTRSLKRNGHPHQLCLFHREKANRIQRKFDRQKRQLVRAKISPEEEEHQQQETSVPQDKRLFKKNKTNKPVESNDFFPDMMLGQPTIKDNMNDKCPVAFPDIILDLPSKTSMDLSLSWFESDAMTAILSTDELSFLSTILT